MFVKRLHLILPGLVCAILHLRLGPLPADEKPDFRALEVPDEIYLCESPEQLSLLRLSDEQQMQLAEIVDHWKTEYLADRKSGARDRRSNAYTPWRDNPLRNSISQLLDDQQHQLYRQMLTLRTRSPVHSRDAYRFELGLSDKQRVMLQDLESKWVLTAMKSGCDYQFPRQSESRDRSQTAKWVEYNYVVTRLGWQFVNQRNAEWSRILTDAQAQRWKEHELRAVFQINGFEIMLADFSSSRQGQGQLRTGTYLDFIVPYFTPPFDVLKWTDKQLPQVQALVKSARLRFDDLPKDREERVRWVAAHQTRQKDCMRQIEQIMTARQRETWWQLFGTPGPTWNKQLLDMRANSPINRP